MLAERMEKWAQEFMKEAELRGELRGELLGAQKSKAETLLQERFGFVPEPVRAKVTSANLDELTAWIGRIFKADSLEAIFQ